MDVFDWLLVASVIVFLISNVVLWYVRRWCPECRGRLRQLGVAHTNPGGFCEWIRCDKCNKDFWRRLGGLKTRRTMFPESWKFPESTEVD